MKVVLFCGGYGMRLRDYSESIPKPMVKIGNRPILWHVMKYYAHFGHTDFILCLGWQGHVIKDYFLNYCECESNDFVMTEGGRNIEMKSRDIHDWSISFVDTGAGKNLGQRLKAIEPLVRDEECFLANYADGVSDLHLPSLIDLHRKSNAVATIASVRPSQSFHVIDADNTGIVQDVSAVANGDVWMNGGYFALTPEIFDVMQSGEEIVNEPFARLIKQQRLACYQHHGFWACLDTYKEMQALEELYTHGDAPWALWDSPESETPIPSVIPTAAPLDDLPSADAIPLNPAANNHVQP